MTRVRAYVTRTPVRDTSGRASAPLLSEFHALAQARSSLHTLSALPTGGKPTRSAPGGLLGEPLVLGPHRYV